VSDGAGEHAYRLLLRLYPRAFRERYGAELLELYRHRRAQTAQDGVGGMPRFWLRLLRDTLGTAWRERARPVPGRGRNRTTSGGDGVMGWMDDVRYAGRRLRRSPLFAATAVLILTLAIGVNTTAFSVVNALLFRAPPFEDPERVVLVLQGSDDGVASSTSYPAYLDMRRYDDVFADVSAYNPNQAFLEQDGTVVPILVEYASSSYLSVLGLSPARGRWLDASGDDPNGPPTAVLSHKMWSERLGSDPDVVGTDLSIGGRSVAVIGVGPETYNGGFGPAAIDLWLSISAMGPTGGPVASLERREDHPFQVRARLREGVALADATAAMSRLADELAATYPELDADRGIFVLPVVRYPAGPGVRQAVMPAATLTMTVVALVLLIGTMNLANLLVVRTSARAQELAVRLALGADRRRLVRVVLTEALLLAGVGGLGAVVLSATILGYVRNTRFDLGLPASFDVGLDARVLGFAAVASVAAGLLFGLLPAWRATARPIRGSLTDASFEAIGARRRFGLTGALVAAQVAASLLLLAVAGVFVESLARAQGAEPGFDWARTGYVAVNVQPLDLDADAAVALTGRLREAIEGRPEVERVTVSALLPGRMFGTTTLLLGSGRGEVDRPREIPWNRVTPGFFETLGIPLVAGRTFEEADLVGPPVAIVSEAMARAYWGRTDVVGQSYRAESAPDEPIEIVGVVGDVPTRSLGEPPRPSTYYPDAGALQYPVYLFVANGPPDGAIAAIRAAVDEVDDRILIRGAAPMRHHLAETLGPQRVAGVLLGSLGALALLLAVLGVYGVVSFAVSRRRHEVGIRMALGAGGQSVVRLFARDVGVVVGLGALLGTLLAIPASALVGALFTGGGASPRSVAAAAVLLLGTALVATVIPAGRAARTDPTLALRRE